MHWNETSILVHSDVCYVQLGSNKEGHLPCTYVIYVNFYYFLPAAAVEQDIKSWQK